jgi:hypothetical protein
MTTLRVMALALVLGYAGGARGGTVVYSNDFEVGSAAGKEWSSEKYDETPRDNRRFLGGFTTDRVTLKVDKLPRHAFVRVSVSLYVMATWDGNAVLSDRGDRVGPDVWRMTLGEGAAERTLVDATFSNFDFESRSVTRAAMTQSYPSVLRGESYPAKTGAAERDALGFEWTFNDGSTHAVDAVYRMTFTVPHEAAELVLAFQGAEGLRPAEDECWGLDDVKVEALEAGEVKPPAADEMRRLWEAVGGHDIVAEADAYWRMVAGADETAKFLRARVRPAGVDRRAFGRLVRQLDADDFAGRERATEGLRAMGPAAEDLLRDAAAHATSAEAKIRLEAALKGLAKTAPNDPEARRHAIAMKLLRTIGTAEARAAVAALSRP